MQGGDIGTEYGKCNIVVMEPLLCYTTGATSKTLRKRFSLTKEKRAAADAERYTYNENMLSWIVWMGRQFSVHTRVWSFLEDDDLYNRLSLHIAKGCGPYITDWQRWDSVSDAYLNLRRDPDVLGVYDADVDRVEQYWHLRGVRVLIGGTP